MEYLVRRASKSWRKKMTSFLAGLFATAYLACPQTLFVNHNQVPMNDKDLEVLELVKDKCKKEYGPDSCVVQFTKYRDGRYYGECGLAEEK